MDDHRLVLKKLQDIQAVTIAEFHIDNRRIFAQPVLAVFTRRSPIVCVVILGRRPEMEHHLTAATCDFDSCGTQFFYGSNDKRVPGYVCKSRPHPRPSIEPFCKMSKRISLRNVHAGDCSAVSKDTRQSVRASGIRISYDLAHAAMIGAALLIYSARGINRNYVKSAAGITLKLGDFYTCSYCLRVIKWDHHRTRPTMDHFFPKSKKQLLMGAKRSFVLCCQPCNSRKSDKVFSSIEEVREFIKSRKTATEA